MLGLCLNFRPDLVQDGPIVAVKSIFLTGLKKDVASKIGPVGTRLFTELSFIGLLGSLAIFI